MSYTLDLCCVECLVALPLGKWVTINEDGETVAGHWGGFRNGWDGRRIAGLEHSEAVAVFCAVHAGHLLGVVETDRLLALLDEVATDRGLFRWIVDVEEMSAERPNRPAGVSDRLERLLSALLHNGGLSTD